MSGAYKSTLGKGPRDTTLQSAPKPTMRFIVAVAPLLAFASIASAVACTISTECEAIPCPSTRPRQCDAGWCDNGTCKDQLCVAKNQECPVRLIYM